MRWTKADILSKIGQCMETVLAFIDLRQDYDYLKATMDILRDKNLSVLKIIKEIDKAYEKAVGSSWFSEDRKTFDQLLACLPDRIWLD